MQIVKWTGWSVEYIEQFSQDELQKLAIWAFNQEAVERQNFATVMRWHNGVKHKKTATKVTKMLNDALKLQNYNPADSQEASDKWFEIFSSMNPQFDKYIEKLIDSRK